MTPLEPKYVPPGNIVRWCKEAFALVRRDMGFWFLIALYFSLCAALALQSFFISSVLMLTCFYLSVALAQASDAELRVTWQRFNEVLRKHFVLALTLSLYQLGTFLCGMVIFLLPFSSTPTDLADLFYAPRALPDLFTNFYQAMQNLFVQPVIVMYLAVLLASFPFLTSTFHFHLMAYLNAPFWQAKAKGMGEPTGNFFIIALADFTMFLVSIALLLTVPFLAPLGCSFGGALSYVAFRDIYLGGSSNVPRVATVRAAQEATTNT